MENHEYDLCIARSPSMPHIRHLSCEPTHQLNTMRKKRKGWFFTFLFVALSPLLLFFITLAKGKDFAWSIQHLPPWYWFLVAALSVSTFMLWLLAGRWITRWIAFAKSELDFSENNLRVSYPRAKGVTELIIPWAAIEGVSLESGSQGVHESINFTFKDENVDLQIQAAIKSLFKYRFLFGSPSWFDSKSNRWVFSIISDPPAIDLVNLIHAWREFAFSPASVFRSKPELAPIIDEPAIEKIIDARLDINKIDYDGLLSLPYIGAAEATRLLKYRQQRGPFSSIEEVSEFLKFKPHQLKRWESMVFVSNVSLPVSRQPAREPIKTEGGREID